MKKKKIEATQPVKTRKMGRFITTQMVEDILVLNIYDNKILRARHCISTNTYENATYMQNKWTGIIFAGALGLSYDSQFKWFSEKDLKDAVKMSDEDENMVLEKMNFNDRVRYRWDSKAYQIIEEREEERSRTMRENTERNRLQALSDLMSSIPELPEDIHDWIDKREIGGMNYATKTEDKKKYVCSHCGKEFDLHEWKREDGEEPRHNDMVICPACKHKVKMLKRSKGINVMTHFSLVQPMDEEHSVIRHFDAWIYCQGYRKCIKIDESIRIMMNKKKTGCRIYYNQYSRGSSWGNNFDDKRNPANRREFAGYLYDGGIEEAFEDTSYAPWIRLFKEFSAAGLKLDYNAMMCGYEHDNYIGIMEMLYRGKFYRLLREQSEKISVWTGDYYGPLNLKGNTIEQVFNLYDKQKINRIRDNNGDTKMLCWMQFAERRNIKISDKTLNWYLKNKLSNGDIVWLSLKMSLEQGMNYIVRQQKESYPKLNVKKVIEQYEDYMVMCEKLKKDMRDEMVYRPRELKRRHDEAVAEISSREAEITADEYSRRFPGVEDVLKDVKERLEYSGETYSIIVPQRCVDIVNEGNQLHHCAGSSDRYFDRIRQRETYIVFLRKNVSPLVPYYTVEVEPGGTIRQHRGYLDEEPEIKEVKPFLREWQQVIRKRMTKEDYKHAEVSAIKRVENLKELEEKNNTRVLEALRQDFMEAI